MARGGEPQYPIDERSDSLHGSSSRRALSPAQTGKNRVGTGQEMDARAGKGPLGTEAETKARIGERLDGIAGTMTSIGRFRRFVVEAIPIVAWILGSVKMLFAGVKATMEANSPGAECQSQDSCVQMSVAMTCALTKSRKAQTVILCIAILGLSLCMVLLKLIYTFKTPFFHNKTQECADLALCFHLNNAYKGSIVSKCKYLAVFSAIAIMCFGLMIASEPNVVWDAIGFPFMVSLFSGLGIFPTTTDSFDYSTYQEAFLLDGNNAIDKSTVRLFQKCQTRVYDAIARQASKDFRDPETRSSKCKAS